ncbi:hypothetical protein [Thalassolituus marinus]|uniref:Lipoprotein n=1 Tax=Thalassolituus marinus TaxID=671053 RepID=A0ABS7ZVZ3_9GAMM|nr:hypothetical protein [Thalassolituus marinus]MCA6065388.1 hypothetical protein [Thalassolituus marinus]
MLKIVAFMLITATLAGCASSRPMRLTEGNYKEVPIVVMENSSGGLRLLMENGVVTVRDMTKKEFSEYEGDAAKYNEARSVRPKSISGAGYHATVGAAGIAAGLTFKYASGLALLGMLSDDPEDLNYPFSWDYHSDNFLVSTSSSLNADEVRAAAIQTLDEFSSVITDEYGVSPAGAVSVFPLEFPGGRVESVFPSDYTFENVSQSFHSDGKKVSAVILYGCQNNGLNCRLSFRIRLNNGIVGLTNPMRERFMEILGGSYALYIAPNSALFNLPSVLYGDGRLEYLVEK